MRRWICCFACVAVWATSASSMAATPSRVTVGSAKTEGRKIGYVQRSTERWHEGKCVGVDTVYLDDAGKTIGRRSVKNGKSALVPDEVFDDLRHGYHTASRMLPDGGIEVRYRSATGEDMERKVLRPKIVPVNAAGVVEAIRAHWGRLVAGGRVDMALIVPQRLDWYQFRLRKSGTGKRGEMATTTFILEPNNALLRAVAGELRFELDNATGGMVRYRGQVDLKDADGDNLQVDVAWRSNLPGARPIADAVPMVAGPKSETTPNPAP